MVKTWRIAHVRGDPINYKNQMRAQLSRDGQYVYFDSNWLGTQPLEIFRTELPTNWWSDIDRGGHKFPI